MAASKSLNVSPAAAPRAESQVTGNGANSSGVAESLLTVNNLVMHFPLSGNHLPEESWRGSGGRRHFVQCQAGRDAGSRWRVRLRQVDHRPSDPSALQTDSR